MAQIFISYKSEERDAVSVIALALQEEGFSVWWDHSLIGGQNYAEVIDAQIAEASVIMPIWSRQSVKSRWVGAEAERGGAKLFPVRIHDVVPPLPYNQLHTLDLTGWKGDRNDPRWQRIVADLSAITSGSTSPLQSIPFASARHARGVASSASGWIAGVAALLAIGVGGYYFLTPRAGETREAQSAIDAELSPTTAEQTLAPVERADEGAAPAPAPDTRGIQTYSEALQAIRQTGAQVALEICTNAPARCGVLPVRVGEVITIRVTSEVSGRLVLWDTDANGVMTQIFPNGLSRSGRDFRVVAGESVQLPLPDQGFVFGISPPAGISRLTAVVFPEAAQLPEIVASNGRTRGIQAIPESSRDDFAAATANVLSGGGSVAIGEVSYTVTP